MRRGISEKLLAVVAVICAGFLSGCGKNDPVAATPPAPTNRPPPKSTSDPFFSKQGARHKNSDPDGPSASAVAGMAKLQAARQLATSQNPAPSQPQVTASSTDPVRIQVFQDVKAKADTGDKDAQFQLAKMYETGDGVPKDPAAALQLYGTSAVAGSPNAQLTMYLKYLSGDGVPKDPAEAARWLELAPHASYYPLQGLLGQAYETGQGIEKNPGVAANLYLSAATHDDLSSQARLGSLLANGPPEVRNDMEAYKWLYVAAARGDQNSAAMLSKLAERMTPDQVSQGKQLGETASATYRK